MNYRMATILARETISSDLTKDIDIDVKDPVSQLVLVYDCLNAATGDADGHPAECLTKIEIIDGSDVLYSLSGVEAQAVDFYHNKLVPSNHIRYLTGNYSYMVFNINFGRFLYDAELALDPGRFSNLKLRVTIDRNAGGKSSVAGRLTVIGHLFDQKTISPIGFLMNKEIKSYTLGDSSHEYTDLPLDHPYRKLFIRAQYNSQAIDEQLANIKLTEDQDKRVPINMTIMQALRAVVSQNKSYREGIIGAGATTARVFYCTPSYRVTFGSSGWHDTLTEYAIAVYDGDGGYFTASQETAGPNFQVNAEGWLPHAVLEIPFGLQNEIADWYDVSGIGNLKLDLTSESSPASGSCEIMLQQLRRY